VSSLGYPVCIFLFGVHGWIYKIEKKLMKITIKGEGIGCTTFIVVFYR
jgi:hypothetical protein